MFFPRNIAEKLSFDQVLEIAKEYCDSELGNNHFDRLKCEGDAKVIGLWLGQTAELKALAEQGELSFALPIDVELRYDQARVKGFHYEVDDILAIRDAIEVTQRVFEFSQHRQDDYPLLHELFKSVEVDFKLIQTIDKVIGPDREVRSNATKTLQQITSEITRSERAVIRNSNKIFNQAKEKGILADTELGIKNGRVVLPVLSEHKRKVNGVLIDQSGTGKISYIEPLELVQLNNELAELQIKMRQEIVRILRDLTSRIAIELPALKRAIQKLAFFDFIRAKGRLAAEWKAILPKLGKNTHVTGAEHPLLRVRLQAEKKQIVPLDYQLDEDQRLMVISGPNAGGKSVALKTVGLLQYMLQSGFLVPCSPNSTFRIFEHIFIDIGDDQSIESDLSTYSSHLKAAKHIINFCDSDTLVLMDEIGTGTDPMFGGPMAEAILEEIHKRGAYGVITTHFSNIKTKTKKLKHAFNAAMLFDLDSLSPLYRLEVGQPGSSFVYEVAANIGMNKKLIKRAKQLTNTKQYDLDALLAEVQTQRDKLDVMLKDATEKEESAARFMEEYHQLRNEIESQKKAMIDQAKKQANDLIAGANQKIEKTIREIKESKADKKRTQQVRKELEQERSNEPVITKEPADLKVGDRVQIVDTTTVGELVEIKKNTAVVQIGNMTTKTKLNKLERVGRKTERKMKQYISTTSYNERQSQFKPELDVRGMRTHEALPEIDQWIDSAIILGMTNLRLVHGKGDGILRTEIRRHLKPHPSVLSIDYERVDMGGEGVSLIVLK